jgi:hypothetical protein
MGKEKIGGRRQKKLGEKFAQYQKSSYLCIAIEKRTSITH